MAVVSRARWKWPYALTALMISSYVRYVLGEKLLDTIAWVKLDIVFGVNSSDAYTDLIWFGPGATICYFLMNMVLNKSYGKLVVERRSVDR